MADDDADWVTRQMELEESRWRKNKPRKVHTLPSTGMCYECSEPLRNNHVFCDAECRDMYDKRRNARQRNHG